MEINHLTWPAGFKTRMTEQLGTEADAFFRALSSPAPTSIRLHHLKGKATFELKEQVPWCANGYYLQERPFFHMDPHWHGGAYYVQEASSMILDAVVRQLDIEDKPRIWLDLCAAPGGKTGILAKHLGVGDVLIANEVVPQRKQILYENLTKAGLLNTFITGQKSSAFPDEFADLILIDAPCAGEGMMRKEPEAATQWSENLVHSCALLQREIVSDAVRTLKPGGILLYSTCSYSVEENIDNVSSFLTRHDLEIVTLQFPTEWQIVEIQNGRALGYQLFPHRVKGEGLFISALRKKGEPSEAKPGKKVRRIFQPAGAWLHHQLDAPNEFLVEETNSGFNLITAPAEALASEIRTHLPRAELIAHAGAQKGKDFIPSHFLAMAGQQQKSFPFIDLDLRQALDYLERKTPLFPNIQTLGWYIARYDTTPLGWMKNTQQGWKNYYPLHWRLRQRV